MCTVTTLANSFPCSDPGPGPDPDFLFEKNLPLCPFSQLWLSLLAPTGAQYSEDELIYIQSGRATF